MFYIFQLAKGQPLPSPSHLKRKILIKNKRLAPDIEKTELGHYVKGSFVIEDEVLKDSDVTLDLKGIPMSNCYIIGAKISSSAYFVN